jgi:hypothetical protein
MSFHYMPQAPSVTSKVVFADARPTALPGPGGGLSCGSAPGTEDGAEVGIGIAFGAGTEI